MTQTPVQFAYGDYVIYEADETAVVNLPRPLPAVVPIALFEGVFRPSATRQVDLTFGISGTIASLTGITLAGLKIDGVDVNPATLVGTKVGPNMRLGLVARNPSASEEFVQGVLTVSVP